MKLDYGDHGVPEGRENASWIERRQRAVFHGNANVEGFEFSGEPESIVSLRRCCCDVAIFVF